MFLAPWLENMESYSSIVIKIDEFRRFRAKRVPPKKKNI